MKRLVVLIGFLLLASGALAEERSTAQDRHTISLFQWGGLETDRHPLHLNPGDTYDAQNCKTDDITGLGPREGYILFSTSPADQLYEFPISNGTRYFIRIATGLITADLGAGDFTIDVSTVATEVQTVGAVLGDRFYFSNTTDGLKYWDGTSVTVASSTLGFDKLASHVGRLWGAGIENAERTIYISEYLDGTNFTLSTAPAVTSPAQITVSGGLDEPITALFSSFLGELVWFTAHSFGTMFGFDRDDFEPRVYSNRIGCSYPNTIKDCEGELRWLGPARTVWGWRGGVLKESDRLSEPIDALMDTVLQGDANQRAFVWTGRSDFSRGTDYQTSHSISAGDLSIATVTVVDAAAADFANGTLSNTSTTTITDALSLATDTANVPNNSFEDGTTTDADNWIEGSVNSDINPQRVQAEGGTSPQSGSWMMKMNGGSYSTSFLIFSVNWAAIIYDGNDLVLEKNKQAGSNFISADNTWVEHTIDLTNYIGRNIRVQIDVGVFGVSNRYGSITSDKFVCNGGTMTFRLQKNSSNGVSYLDNLTDGRSSIITGVFTSQSFDTSLASAAWFNNTTDVRTTVSSHTFTWETRTSTNDADWRDWVDWSTFTAPSSDWDRYIQYRLTISTTDEGGTLPYVTRVPIHARAATGTWTSDSIAGGGQSVGTFDANYVLNGGSATFAFFTDTDSAKTVTNGVVDMNSVVSSAAVVAGGIPAVSTAAYYFIQTNLDIVSVATNTPKVQDARIRWNEGNIALTPAIYVNGRYWLGVAIGSTSNTTCLVFDRNRKWQRWEIPATAMAIYNSDLYFSNTNGIFQAETGYMDNGSAIESYWRHKRLAPGGIHRRSIWDTLRLTTDYSDETITASFYPNGTDSEITLGSRAMNLKDGDQDFAFPFTDEDLQQGKFIDLKLSVTGTTKWNVLNLDLYHQPDPLEYDD